MSKMESQSNCFIVQFRIHLNISPLIIFLKGTWPYRKWKLQMREEVFHVLMSNIF